MSKIYRPNKHSTPAEIQLYVDGMIAAIEEIEYLLTLPQLNEVKPFKAALKKQRKRLTDTVTK